MAIFRQIACGIWASGCVSVNGTTMRPRTAERTQCVRGAERRACLMWTIPYITLPTTPCYCRGLSNYTGWIRYQRRHPLSSETSVTPLLQQCLCWRNAQAALHSRCRRPLAATAGTTWSPGLRTGLTGELKGREDCADMLSRLPFCGCFRLVLYRNLCFPMVQPFMFCHLPISAQTIPSLSTRSQQTSNNVSNMKASQVHLQVLNICSRSVEGVSISCHLAFSG